MHNDGDSISYIFVLIDRLIDFISFKNFLLLRMTIHHWTMVLTGMGDYISIKMWLKGTEWKCIPKIWQNFGILNFNAEF